MLTAGISSRAEGKGKISYSKQNNVKILKKGGNTYLIGNIPGHGGFQWKLPTIKRK